jgi:hypothetical protein
MAQGITSITPGGSWTRIAVRTGMFALPDEKSAKPRSTASMTDETSSRFSSSERLNNSVTVSPSASPEAIVTENGGAGHRDAAHEVVRRVYRASAEAIQLPNCGSTGSPELKVGEDLHVAVVECPDRRGALQAEYRERCVLKRSTPPRHRPDQVLYLNKT